MTKAPFTGHSERASDLLGLIHSDACGPVSVVARGGYSYFVTFNNDLSRYGYVYLMKHKSEYFDKFKEFLYSQSYGGRTHLVCGFVITFLFRSLVGNAPIPRPVQLMRDLDVGMLRNAHIHWRLFPSSFESTTASTGRTSHEIGESSDQSQRSSQRLPRRRPTRAQLPRTQTEVAPAWAQQLLQNQNTLMQSVAALQQQEHGFDKIREALGFENPTNLPPHQQQPRDDNPSASRPPQ
ncbi:unnamed protein product [Cuscuta campestris]|uniref:Uncharacterized protein n=1 Tax=Cuscuta campestris TaxID=132261 RepID=A0A484MR94_9ASTE|nr:unnamed protein product [Cuscuta campestris]